MNRSLGSSLGSRSGLSSSAVTSANKGGFLNRLQRIYAVLYNKFMVLFRKTGKFMWVGTTCNFEWLEYIKEMKD